MRTVMQDYYSYASQWIDRPRTPGFGAPGADIGMQPPKQRPPMLRRPGDISVGPVDMNAPRPRKPNYYSYAQG